MSFLIYYTGTVEMRFNAARAGSQELCRFMQS